MGNLPYRAAALTVALSLGLIAMPAAADDGLFRPDDPMFADQWSLEQPSDADIDAPEAWALLAQLGGAKREIVVAIVDDGFDLSHPELAGRLWVNEGEIPGNGVDDDGNGYIDDVHGYDFSEGEGNPEGGWQHHGMGVAGVIGAQHGNGVGIAGLASPAGVKLMLLRKDYRSPEEAFDYARMMGADIVNNSWGYDTGGVQIISMIYAFDSEVRDASRRLSDADVVQTFAAGHVYGPYPDVWDTYDFPGVLRVTYSDRDDRYPLDRPGHQNPLTVEIVAPRSVPSLSTDGQYWMFGGTSSAAPHVAGVAALLRAAFPALTAAQVAEAIMRGVDVPSPGFAAYSRSGGRLNAHKALQEARKLSQAG